MSHPILVIAGPERLDDIQPLWEGLNRLHAGVTPHFKESFGTFVFADRKAYLSGKAENGDLRIFFIEVDNTPIGYCVASLSNEKRGEIESIFIEEAFRGRRLGDTLMGAALQWMDDNEAQSKSINVVYGNEVAHPFYAKYGFYPRSTTLIQK